MNLRTKIPIYKKVQDLQSLQLPLQRLFSRRYHYSKRGKDSFVCNTYSKKRSYRFDKVYYRRTTAHRHYRTFLAGFGSNINIFIDSD